jgi:hypothetical protein
MKVALANVDGSMPRTVFYDQFALAVTRNRRFAGIDVPADVLLPAEDVSFELNWPRYGRMESAFVRGQLDPGKASAYVRSFVAMRRTCCVVNMHPFVRVPLSLANAAHVIVADINLAAGERSVNPRTISMPALPIVAGRPETRPRPILASFRGIRSHACRGELARLHNGRDIVCQFVDRSNHVGKLDATAGQVDHDYAALLANSVFAFVPRGDALFSYRLLEVMSFGCIPIVLSDGWILPFERSIDWPAIALCPRESEIAGIPSQLAALSAERIANMQRGVAATYATKLSSFDAIVEALFGEIELILAQPG